MVVRVISVDALVICVAVAAGSGVVEVLVARDFGLVSPRLAPDISALEWDCK